MFKPHPRTQNTFTLEGKPLVAKSPHFNGDYLPASVSEASVYLADWIRQSNPEIG